jgi:hypothetical protein
MTSSERLTIILSAIGIIGIPTLLFVVRATVKWTRVEDRLTQIARDVEDLVKDKDRAHRVLLDEIRADRKASNERLTWLERNVWKPGRRQD